MVISSQLYIVVVIWSVGGNNNVEKLGTFDLHAYYFMTFCRMDGRHSIGNNFFVPCHRLVGRHNGLSKFMVIDIANNESMQLLITKIKIVHMYLVTHILVGTLSKFHSEIG